MHPNHKILKVHLLCTVNLKRFVFIMQKLGKLVRIIYFVLFFLMLVIISTIKDILTKLSKFRYAIGDKIKLFCLWFVNSISMLS